MSIKIKVSDAVRFPVEGKLRDADGKEKDFSFELVMDRMDQEQFDQSLTDPDSKVSDLVPSKARDWNGVVDTDGKTPVPFSQDALKQLLLIPGLTTIVWVSYCKHAGVQAKNSERSSA